MFKKAGFKRLNAAVQRVNNVLMFFERSNFTETNNLTVASSVWVSRQLGLKKSVEIIKKNQNHGGNAELKVALKN